WSALDDPADRDAQLDVAVAIVGDAEIAAGQPFTLHVKVHNPGDRTLEQVHLITDCARDELDGIELLIGKLEPGATQTRDLDLQVLASHESFVDSLAVAAHVGEPDASPDGEAAVRIAVSGATRPRY